MVHARGYKATDRDWDSLDNAGGVGDIPNGNASTDDGDFIAQSAHLEHVQQATRPVVLQLHANAEFSSVVGWIHDVLSRQYSEIVLPVRPNLGRPSSNFGIWAMVMALWWAWVCGWFNTHTEVQDPLQRRFTALARVPQSQGGQLALDAILQQAGWTGDALICFDGFCKLRGPRDMLGTPAA